MKQIRESKFSKIVAYYLILTMFFQVVQPMQMYALTGGPSQPEFSSFTPIGTSDMVDLASGDFNYNIPIMDVGGYPLNLAYNSGVTMDQEASWVGLGWDMSVGQIGRQVRGLPDDFNGDPMVYENNMKTNTTVGGNVNVFIAPFGAGESVDLNASVGLGIKYNNYDGYGFSINGGLTYQVSDNLSVGMSMESSSTDGVSASPSVSFSGKFKDKTEGDSKLTTSIGVSMNSRKGVESMTMSSSYSRVDKAAEKGVRNADGSVDEDKYGTAGSSSGASIGGGSVSYMPADFTPSKRVGMTSSNDMFSLNVEGAVYGVDPGVKFAGYRNSQGIKPSEKYKIERGFGYENTDNATAADVLDFNREKDKTVNKNTISLPVTNYTHDLYSVQGQGVGGMFRPYRGQVGFVYDSYIRDDSNGNNLGGEIGAGAGTHFGMDYARTESKSSTGLWTSNNIALRRTIEKRVNNPNYEKVFFKNIGGGHVDKDMKNLFYDNLSVNPNASKLGGYGPISFRVDGSTFSRYSSYSYYEKFLNTPLNVGSEPYIIRGKNRLNRNQTIQKITREEAYKFGTRSFSPFTNKKSHKNHTSEIRIIKDGGERYNYARAAYNVTKKEVTFDISGRPGSCATGLVGYNSNPNPMYGDNSPNNQRNGDQYFNRITTPAFAHTYLLTSVLSSDYQDLKPNGPTAGPSDDDLGTYTKFTYVNKGKDSENKFKTYKWRVPLGKDQANYDEGLRSLKKDDKANYQYGEKELLYVNTIETKTHVAVFTISARKDAHGVFGENGGVDFASESAKMWKLEKISLYSKPEYLEHKDNLENAVPIKVAHFEYDYSLCPNVKNNSKAAPTAPSELRNEGGKLTLRKVYFTYRNSNMGKYTPYEFHYGDAEDEEINPAYNQKDYDIWGNYKKNTAGIGCGTRSPLSTAEFPYVDQSSKEAADKNASVWLLRSIDLPSGGEMALDYESDDYRYVQNKEVMEMFKVVGSGDTPIPSAADLIEFRKDVLTATEQNSHSNYLYIKLDKPYVGSNADFFRDFVSRLGNQSIYFRFLVNMTNPNADEPDKYDYVTGYLQLDNSNGSASHTLCNGGQYAAIRINSVARGDGATGSNTPVNPVTKAGWYFGKKYLNNVVYSLTGSEDVKDVEGVVKNLINIVPAIFDIFSSPNQILIRDKIAKNFVTGKSWIRLMQPESKKFGGGSRVKGIQIKDKWDVMTNHAGEEVYKQFYGQEYEYKSKEGMSSGVATYEPQGSKENPLVQPFYNPSRPELLLGNQSENYEELPFGESFYPSPKVTYSRVSVKNLPRNKTNASDEIITIKKHATGKVVSEFFTSFDYPTISDLTKISSKYDNSDLASILNVNVKTHLTMAQGFSIHTNDMDGKQKSQWVYAEGQTDPISGMEYKYNKLEGNQPNRGKLDNEVVTIDSQGNIVENIVGVDYDVINDFRENNSDTETAGIHFNTEGLPLTLIFVIVPIPIPSYSHHENILRTAVTTKVIHSTGILRETIAYDLGSKVSTKNLAWDADTGQVLLTETVNEYNDKYFSFSMPAYWANEGMSQTALNLGLKWNIESTSGPKYKFKDVEGLDTNAKDYLTDGDEVWVTATTPVDKKGFKAWVVDVVGNEFKLIDEKGLKVITEASDNRPTSKAVKNGSIKVIKSGHRNMQTASMASVTLMKNPLFNYDSNNMTNMKNHIYPESSELNPGNPFFSTGWQDNKIINASAVEYKNVWPGQCECNLPKMIDSEGNLRLEYKNDNSAVDFDIVEKKSFNPYIYNLLGNWRAVKSYAYLTGRYNEVNTPRNTGYFNNFRSFYVYDAAAKKWKVVEGDDYEKWTFASEVSQYSASGQEVENKDALDRYSSAVYGYNNRFPVAVASNTMYKELAFDGFEDYTLANCAGKSHFSFDGVLQKNKVFVTDKQSHTGKRSIRLEPAAKVTMQRKKIVNCDPAQTNKAKVIKAKTITKKIAKK